jgi:hypothetical protein
MLSAIGEVPKDAAEFELNEIDAESSTLVGPSWQALNCVEPATDGPCTPQAIATADLQGNFLFPAPDIADPEQATALGDSFAEATAYYHVDRFQAHLRGLGLPGLPCQTNRETPTIVYGEGGPWIDRGGPRRSDRPGDRWWRRVFVSRRSRPGSAWTAPAAGMLAPTPIAFRVHVMSRWCSRTRRLFQRRHPSAS